MKKALIVACLSALVAGCLAISFRLEPEVRKCVKEEVHKDVLVVGEYRLSDDGAQRTDLVVGCLPPRDGEDMAQDTKNEVFSK